MMAGMASISLVLLKVFLMHNANTIDRQVYSK